MEADDQAIQTILLGLPEDIYAAVDSCETAQEIWLRVQQMMKGSDIGIQEKKAKLFNEWERNGVGYVTIVHQTKDLHTVRLLQLFRFLEVQSKGDPTTAMNMALVLMAKAFKLNYSTPTNIIQEEFHSNPRNSADCQTGYETWVRSQMRMVGCLCGNQFRQYAGQNGVQNVGTQNGIIVVLGITNQNPNGNGNVVAARAEGNAQSDQGKGAAYSRAQLLIAQKEEAGIQLQAEEFDLMAAAADLDEIEEVNANCILMANLQQASTSEEQYTELLEPIPEPHQVQQNDSNVISDISSVEQEGKLDSHPTLLGGNTLERELGQTPISVSQPHVVTEKMLILSNWFIFTGVDIPPARTEGQSLGAIQEWFISLRAWGTICSPLVSSGFSVEVAFRRNSCFRQKILMVVDLLKEFTTEGQENLGDNECVILMSFQPMAFAKAVQKPRASSTNSKVKCSA
ncbi:hypothetical protein Tco_1235806 [Tanacetum coccineum]